MQPPTDWQSQLVEAAAAGQHEALSRLLQQQPQQEGVCADAPRHALGQALLAAAAHGQALCCQAVLTAAAAQHLAHLIIGERNEAQLTPLMLAAQKGFDACIPILLSWAPLGQLTAVDKMSKTALVHAVCEGHVNSIRALLQQAPDSQLTAADSNSWTALHHAASKGHADCIKTLLVQMSETQLTAKTSRHDTALHIAASKGHTDCVASLLMHMPEVQVTATDEYGWTALHLAAGEGHTDCIKALLQHVPEVQVTATASDGCTALHIAARQGHADCVTALLMHVPEAQVTATDEEGWTALHDAAFEGHTDCVQALLMHVPEAQLTATDEEGWTPLHHAAFEGHTDCVQALLMQTPEVQLTAMNGTGQTALHLAADEGHTDCMTALLMHMPKEQLTATDKEGCIALHYAAGRGRTDCVAALLVQMPQVQLGAENLRGWCAALLAVHGEHAATAELLLARMVDLKVQVRGETCGISSEAVYWGKPAVLRLLLSRQPVEQRELDTALMETLHTLADDLCPVASACKAECVRLLLAHKARLQGVEDAMFTQLWPILHDLAGRLCPDSKAVATLAKAMVGLAAEVRSQQACGAAAGAAHLTGSASSSNSSGQHRKRARTEATLDGPPVAASPTAVVAKLFQWAAQGDCWQLQRVLSLRDTPQRHLDLALTVTLTVGMAEGAITAKHQLCVLLLMARGARLQLQFPPAVGQAEAKALAALWPLIKDWAAAVYVADAATQAVQGGTAAVQLF